MSAENVLFNPVQVRYADDGSAIFVSINPREVLTKLTPDTILEALLDSGFSSFEFQLDQDVLDELCQLNWQRLNRVLVRRIAYRVEFDLQIRISQDRMQAYVNVKPAFAKEKIIRERLIERLAFAGVKMGLLPEAIEHVLQETEATDLLIAQGQAPVHGDEARIEQLYQPLSISHYSVVNANTPLLRIHPPTNGRDGFKVSGQKIPAEAGIAMQITAGEGVRFDPSDPNLVLAQVNGLPIRLESCIRLDHLITLTDLKDLKAEYPLSVLIQGSLPAGSKIKSAGHIIVQGNVSRSVLQAEGELIITGEVSGPSELRSSSHMHLNSVQHALIHCGHNLYLQALLRHCQAYICGQLHGIEATIEGGLVQSFQSAELKTIGTHWRDSTEIHLGPSLYFNQYLYHLMAELKDQQYHIETNLKRLIRTRSQIGEGSQTNRLLLEQQMLSYHEFALKSEFLCLNQVFKDHSQLEIKVQDAIYANSQFHADNRTLEIETKTPAAIITWNSGQPLSLSYQAAEIATESEFHTE